MSGYYIGTRTSKEDMQKLLPEGFMLSGGYAKCVRQAVMDKGIKQMEDGKRIEFYEVDEEQHATLTYEYGDEWSVLTHNVKVHPLVEFKKEDYDKLERKAWDKHKFRKDYEKEMRTSLAKIIKVIGEDLNLKFSGPNPYSVGDWVKDETNCYKVLKTTNYTYSYAPLIPKDGYITNKTFADKHFKNVVGFGNDGPRGNLDWNFTIPYKGNEDKFIIDESKTIQVSIGGIGGMSKQKTYTGYPYSGMLPHIDIESAGYNNWSKT